MSANPEPAEDRLTFEVELEASPDQVWRALSEPETLAAWLEPDAVGADHGGPIDCRPIEAEPGRSIRYAWRGGDQARPLDTEVLFEIAETAAGGVRLVVTHSGFPTAKVVSLATYRKARSLMSLRTGALKWAA